MGRSTVKTFNEVDDRLGGHRANRTAVSGDYTVDGNDYVVGVTDTSSARTVTLASSEVRDGRVIVVNDESNSASTNGITVDTEGSESIDGSSSQSISTDSGSLRLYSDGSDWFSF
jgi:hypothetical protein